MTAARIAAVAAGVVLMLVALAVFASPASGLGLLAAFTALGIGAGLVAMPVTDWWLD